jgi:hypothetical protein
MFGFFDVISRLPQQSTLQLYLEPPEPAASPQETDRDDGKR